jgi:phosphatidylserine/phosphatidylglycerophosphate/cardiolipin synthase-like enzyme
MTKKKTRPTRRTRQPAVRGPLAIGLLLVIVAIIAAMALNVPAGLWAQPGFNELQAEVLDALGLPHPVAAAPTPTPATPLPAAREPSPTAGPAAGAWYRVYFTDPRYPDVASEREAGIDAHLVQLIDSAQRTVDVAAYELDLETVVDALLRAKERGVTVRLVTDTDNLEEEAVQRLKKGGVPVVEDDRSAIMHQKFVIVDGRTVMTGSWNLTVNCTYRNNNNAIYIESEALARNYQAEFDEMFEEKRFGPTSPRNTVQPQLVIEGTRVENYFAPEDKVSPILVDLVSNAQKSIHFLAFSFTHDDLGQAMLERAKAGVKVSGVFETRGADTQHGEYPPMREAGLDVHLDGNPYVMHHKVIIVDEAIVVTGSYNFSASADESNDENVLIIHNPDIAQQYLEEFQRVRQRAIEAAES